MVVHATRLYKGWPDSLKSTYSSGIIIFILAISLLQNQTYLIVTSHSAETGSTCSIYKLYYLHLVGKITVYRYC